MSALKRSGWIFLPILALITCAVSQTTTVVTVIGPLGVLGSFSVLAADAAATSYVQSGTEFCRSPTYCTPLDYITETFVDGPSTAGIFVLNGKQGAASDTTTGVYACELTKSLLTGTCFNSFTWYEDGMLTSVSTFFPMSSGDFDTSFITVTAGLDLLNLTAPTTTTTGTASASASSPSAPSTSVVSTNASSTSASSTSAPSTSAPSTSAPSTSTPSTSAPSTSALSTSALSTSAPPTSASSTSASSASNTGSNSGPSTAFTGAAIAQEHAYRGGAVAGLAGLAGVLIAL